MTSTTERNRAGPATVVLGGLVLLDALLYECGEPLGNGLRRHIIADPGERGRMLSGEQVRAWN
ncbi:hypothetical protein BV882_12085 [Streptomyces sp. 46]|nr:hypothetical protein BV882_12085 [Streptomyces sp. 46]